MYLSAKASIDSVPNNTSTVAFDDGVTLDFELAGNLYSRMSDSDKNRLKMPEKGERLKPGNSGTLPIGGLYFKLVITETNPEFTSIQHFNKDSGRWETRPVRVMQYNSGHRSNKQLCGDVIVVDTSRRAFHIQLENEMIDAREPKLKWGLWGQVAPATTPPTPTEYWRQDAPQSEFMSAEKLFSTNLHTHGLHVSPEGFQDDIFLNLPARPKESDPPTCLSLVYQIKPEHVPGTFWYHSHLHHSSAYQVTSGLAGALITVSKPNNRVFDLDDIAEIAAANVKVTSRNGKELSIGRVLVLQQFILSKAAEKTKNGENVWIVDPGTINDRRSLKEASTILAEPDVPATEFISVNGGTPLNITMSPKQIERWRFVCAAKEASIPLVWYKVDASGVPTQAVGDDLKVVRIAEDGIPCLDTDASNQFVNHAVANQELLMFPGYRSDLLIQPLAKGTYLLVNGTGSLDYSPQVLARIVVDGAERPMRLPSVNDVARCIPEDIVIPSADPTHVDQTISFEFADKEQFGVNGAPYIVTDPPKIPNVEPIVQVLNQAQRWELKINVPPMDNPKIVFPTSPGSTGAEIENVLHPFHIHVNPFQVELGEGKLMWKDTFVVSKSGGSVFIRIQPSDYLGSSVLHCHILDHEDQGMMRNIQIVPPPMGKKLLKNLTKRFAPESLFAKGKLHVAVVFSGPACEFCNESLKQLQNVSGTLADGGTEITAISREKLTTPMLLSNLTIIDSQAIRSEIESLVGSSIIPSHATYLIDKRGTIRYYFTGDHPISNTGEVVEKMRELFAE